MSIFNKIYILFILLFILLFINIFNSAHAIEDKLIVVTRLYPPYIYPEGDDVKGISSELVKYVFNKMNQKYQIIIQPWNRSHGEIESGKADIIFTVNRSPERDKIMTYNNEPLVHQNMSFYKKKTNDAIFNGDYKNLKNKTIGYVRAAYYGDTFMKGIKDNNIVTEESWDYEKCILKLQSDRYDVIVGSEKVVEYLMKNLNIDRKEYVKLQPKVETITSFLGFSKKKDYTKIKAKFDEILLKIKNSGEYEKIVKRSVNLE